MVRNKYTQKSITKQQTKIQPQIKTQSSLTSTLASSFTQGLGFSFAHNLVTRSIDGLTKTKPNEPQIQEERNTICVDFRNQYRECLIQKNEYECDVFTRMREYNECMEI